MKDILDKNQFNYLKIMLFEYIIYKKYLFVRYIAWYIYKNKKHISSKVYNIFFLKLVF